MSPKVLVVDDEPNVRQVLLFVLDPICRVLEASNGRDALRLIKVEKPSLVLLDVALPEMDGLSILKAARQIDPDLAVVMLTCVSNMAIVESALKGGARAYLTKPFDSTLLRGQVQLLLEELAAPAEPYRPWRVKAC